MSLRKHIDINNLWCTKNGPNPLDKQNIKKPFIPEAWNFHVDTGYVSSFAPNKLSTSSTAFRNSMSKAGIGKMIWLQAQHVLPELDQLVPIQITDYSLSTKFLPDQQSQSQTRVFSAPRRKIYFFQLVTICFSNKFHGYNPSKVVRKQLALLLVLSVLK